MTAILLKLVNGDEIIGDMSIGNIESKTIEIMNPLVIETKPNTNGAIAFVLNKYISFSCDNKITININNIIAMSNISEDMEKYWKANVEYIRNVMTPVMESNIRRGLQYFNASMDELIPDDETNTDEITEEQFMEELLNELEPPSKLKH